MFPTIGRLTITDHLSIDDAITPDNLIYCDWCRWKDTFNGINAAQCKQKQWVAIPDVDITVTAEDKKSSALFLAPHLSTQLQNIQEEDHLPFWKNLSHMLKEGYNDEDIIILQNYVNTKDSKQLALFKASVQKGVADICPACIGEVIAAFPHHFK